MASCHVAVKVVKKRTLTRSAPENEYLYYTTYYKQKNDFLQSLIEYGAIGINSMMKMKNYEWGFCTTVQIHLHLIYFY